MGSAGWGVCVYGGLLSWLQTLGKEEVVPSGFVSGEPNKKQWGCPNKLGNSAQQSPGEGECVPIKEERQPVDRVEGGS